MGKEDTYFWVLSLELTAPEKVWLLVAAGGLGRAGRQSFRRGGWTGSRALATALCCSTAPDTGTPSPGAFRAAQAKSTEQGSSVGAVAKRSRLVCAQGSGVPPSQKWIGQATKKWLHDLCYLSGRLKSIRLRHFVLSVVCGAQYIYIHTHCVAPVAGWMQSTWKQFLKTLMLQRLDFCPAKYPAQTSWSSRDMECKKASQAQKETAATFLVVRLSHSEACRKWLRVRKSTRGALL